MSQVNIKVKLNYIHAEKLAELSPRQVQFQIQLTLPSGEIKTVQNKILIPYVFNLNSNPPIANVILKGEVDVIGEKEKIKSIKEGIKNKKIPREILQVVTQYTMLEAMILIKELGMPPPVPIPIPPSDKKQPPSTITPI